MKEAPTVTIDTLRPLRRAIGAGVLYVGHLFRGLRPRLKKRSNAAGPIPHSWRWRPEGDRRQCVPMPKGRLTGRRRPWRWSAVTSRTPGVAPRNPMATA